MPPTEVICLIGAVLLLVSIFASNDPMAVLLTTTIIGLLVGKNTSLLSSGITLVLQLTIGEAIGYGMGYFIVWLLNRLQLNTQGLYAVATIALTLLTYGISTFFGGNGFLAVYIAGIRVGNRSLIHQDYITGFHDGFAWLMQIIMFLTLGMLSVPFTAKLSALAAVVKIN
jgi:cell volume regulation protein A